MRNQGFPWFIKMWLLPFLPLIWWWDRQSDLEVLAEIGDRQERESQRLRPYQQFIDLSPEEILYGESEHYEAFRRATGLKREYLRAVIDFDIPVGKLKRVREALKAAGD